MRYALLSRTGDTVENVIVADEAFAEALRRRGRTVVGPLAARLAVGPGYSYDGRNFTPPPSPPRTLEPRELTAIVDGVPLPAGSTPADTEAFTKSLLEALQNAKR